MLTRARTEAWADVPVFESEALQGVLDGGDLGEVERTFLTDLARDGLAVIDLDEAGRALCDRAVQETEPFFKPGVNRVQDAWLRSPAVRTLATLPEVLRRLELAYGRPAYPFQTLNFRCGSQQAVHSDAIHFHSQPERFMCGLWVALEDVSADSGPLLYRPGSHRLPVLTMRGAGVNGERPVAADYTRVYLPALHGRLEAEAPVRPALLRKGQAVVWAANLAHGGAPVLNPASTRRSLVVHYFFKGCLPFTPMTSEVEAQRFSVRLPANVATGGVEWPMRDGRPAVPNKGQIVDTLLRVLLRRMPAS